MNEVKLRHAGPATGPLESAGEDLVFKLKASDLLRPTANGRYSARELKRMSREYRGDMETKFGLLSPEDPACVKSREIADRLREASGVDIPLNTYIMEEGKESNGFALPDGSVMAWPALLSKFDTEDEIAAFLAHEYVHILRGHAAKRLEIETQRRGSVNTGVKIAGKMRQAEIEANVLSMITLLGDAGFNPMGIINMLRKFDEDDGPRSWDLSHGSALDMRLMAESVVYVMHLHGSEREFTPVAPELKDHLDTLTAQESKRKDPEGELEPHAMARKVLESVASSISGEITPENLEARLEASNAILKCISSIMEDHCRAIRRKNDGRVPQKEINAAIGDDPVLLECAVAESAILNGLLDYLGSEASEHEAEARLWLAVQWVSAESDVDLFSPLEGTQRSLLDLLRFQIADEDLVTCLLDSIEKSVEETGDPLLYITASFDRQLLEKAPFFTAFHRVPDPAPAILWAERGSGIFLDTEDDLPSADKVVATLGPFIEVYRDALELEREEGTVSSMAVRTLVSSILENVAASAGQDKKTFVSQISGNTPLARKVRFFAEIDALKNGELPLKRLLEYASETEGLPPVEQLELLLELCSLLSVTDDCGRGEILRNFLGTYREKSAQFLEELLRHCPREDIEMLSNEFASELAGLIFTEDYEIDPEWRETFLAFIRSAFRYLPEGVESPISSLCLYSQETEIFSELCLGRYEGDIRAMISADSERAQYIVSAFIEILEEVDSSATPREKLEKLAVWYEKFPFSVLDTAWISSQITGASDNFACLNQEIWVLAEVKEVNRLSPVILAEIAPHLESASDFRAVSILLDDPELKSRVLRYATEIESKGADYEELRKLVFEDSYGRTPLLSSAGEALCEKEARSGEELAEVNEGILNRTLETSDRSFGWAAILDGILEYSLEDSEEILLAGLQTSRDETALAGILCRKWWKRFGDTFEQNVFSQDYGYEPDWVDEDFPTFMMGAGNNVREPWRSFSIRDLLERLYSATPEARFFIVQKLLTGPGGILHSKEQTFRLMETFLDEYVSIPPSWREETLKIVKALVEEATIDELFFRIAPFVSRAIFQRPVERAEPEKVLAHCCIDGKRGSMLGGELEDFSGKMGRFPGMIGHEEDPLYPAGRKFIRLLFNETSGGEKDAAGRGNALVREALPLHLREPATFERMDGVTALKMFLGVEGQLGARAAQIIPQCFEIPDDLAPAFEGVYDQQKGQVRPEAVRTITKLAPTLIRPSDKLSPRIGGGSLATVYVLERVGEDPRVLKVLNPNAELRVGQSCDLWSRVLARLESEEPGNTAYRFFAEAILGDLETWLKGDVQDTRFHELDPEFRKQWDGYRMGKCTLVVPVSEKVDLIIAPEKPLDSVITNRHIKPEEFVPGFNLTELQIGEVSEPADGTLTKEEMRNVLGILLHNYIEQLRTGVVHANPHPGNYRVLPERDEKGNLQVAILDRNFYQEFPAPEVKAMTRMRASLDVTKVLAANVLDAILSAPENAGSEPGNKKEIQELVKGYKFEDLESVQKLLRELRQRGLHVPLRYTLFMLGINAFDAMCREKGFAGMADVIKPGKLVMDLVKARG